MTVKTELNEDGDGEGPSANSGVFKLRLGPLKSEWFTWCKARNVKPSDAMKRAMVRLMASGKTPATYAVQPVIEKKKGVEIKLTKSERAAADQRAKEQGFRSTNLWIAATVRAALTNTPQFGQQEIEALGQSNLQLLAIGRNLNQIAKRMNAAKDELVVTTEDVEMIDALVVAVRKHVKKVGDALRASIYRWGIK